MNAKTSSLLVLVALACGAILVGCSDETKADPAAVDAMNAQRKAMPAGGNPAASATAGAPGASAPK